MDAPGTTILMTTRSAQSCAELALVLEARSIPVRQERLGRSWVLRVPDEAAAAAQAELAAYARENRRAARFRAPPTRVGSGWPGVIVYLAVLVALTAATARLGFGFDWLGLGRMDSGRFVAGEWWRAATALTLHADAAHLLGNAAFGAFFGYFIGRSFGGGFGWLVIVLSGVVGNALNGLVTVPSHRSVGASTAVFGALGLLTAYSWRRGFPADASTRERIAPVIAGLGLLAFTGASGENTDIGAHLLGFVSGFAAGLVAARIGPPRGAAAQTACAVAAAALVAGAWGWGLAAG